MQGENAVKRKHSGLGTLFNMVLFLVFLFCALFTVLIGSRVYENIHVRNRQNYKDYVILHYVANKVRQGDMKDSVTVDTIDGTPVLNLFQDAQGKKYVTRIYAYDGKLRELFMKSDADLGLADGLEITDCESLEIEKKDSLLYLRTGGKNPEELVMNLKCADGGNGT
jgi:hypothetical protein